MEFKAKASDLRGAVTDAVSVASKNASQNFKNAILLSAAPLTGISLTATDLDNVLRIRISNAEVLKEGVALLSGSKLKGILAVFSQDDLIEASIDNNILFLKSAGFEFHLPTLPLEGFPRLELELDGVSATFPPGGFQRCVKLVASARATDIERLALTGIHVEARESGVGFIATDTHSIACAETQAAASAASSVLLSRSFIDGILKLLPGGGHDLTLSFNASHAKVRTGSYEFKGKILAEAFPNWRSAVPVCGKSVILEREPLLAAFKAAGLIDQKILLELKDSSCEISAISREGGGDARFSFSLSNPAESLKIIFPDSDIIETLSAIDSSTVEIRFNNGTSPVILKTPGDDHYFCVITPMIAVSKTVEA